MSASDGSVLSPIDRLTEVLYGILLMLTFTGTLRVVSQDEGDVSATLWAAVGCSLAWGLVDGCMYAVDSLASRNRSYYLLRKLRQDPTGARKAVMDSMPDRVAESLSPGEWDKLVAALARLPVPPRAPLKREDLVGGVLVFLLANAALLPLAAPFALIRDLDLAHHISNGLALVMLFVAGAWLARYTGQEPLRVGLGFVIFGVALVGVTLALGG